MLEQWSAFVSLIDARLDISVGVCSPDWRLFCLLVGEILGEEFVLSVIFEIFEFGECSKGNKVVVSLEMVLWELLVMEMV